MNTPQLDKTYDPKAVEARWYQTWNERGYFHASPSHPGQP
jgi:valyl-tRNA synthetase